MLKSILSNSSPLSASSRRPEDVKMLRLQVLYAEQGRCWDYPYTYGQRQTVDFPQTYNESQTNKL